MGLFDTVKLKANALAADAQRAGKVTAAQSRIVVLQNDIRKAERELGHSAFPLLESGELDHPGLAAAVSRLREARQALTDKEAEIEALRHGTEADDAAPADTAGEPPAAGDDTAPVAAGDDAMTGGRDAPVAEDPGAAASAPAAQGVVSVPKAETAEPVPAAAPEKPAAKRRTPAAKKPAAKKPAAEPRGTAAKKPAAARKPAADKPAADKPPAAD